MLPLPEALVKIEEFVVAYAASSATRSPSSTPKASAAPSSCPRRIVPKPPAIVIDDSSTDAASPSTSYLPVIVRPVSVLLVKEITTSLSTLYASPLLAAISELSHSCCYCHLDSFLVEANSQYTRYKGKGHTAAAS